MTNDLKKIEELYHRALAKPKEERAAFLAEACAGDEALHRELQSMLVALEKAGGFMELPALEHAARLAGQAGSQLLAGHQLGPYRIGPLLGRGGMGEVYRAVDTRLDRPVAIKILPDLFAGVPERIARFEREAKLLASLNHPNIAAIHGLEEAEGKRFLVLELVEGKTLSERLSKRPLPMEEAFRICSQIAEGLEAAHEKGIIHRDLKPSNVKITPEGKVKILDFGLAKACQKEGADPDLSQSPTLTGEMTREGVILGTAAYMSPEQATGKPVDKRTDIWAFGCVMFECLTGRQAFQGGTITEILAAILKGEPDWQLLQAGLPPPLEALLCRCLEKDARRRIHDIADVRIQLEDGLGAARQGAPLPAERATRSQRRLMWRLVVPSTIVLGVGLAVLCILLIRHLTTAKTPAGTTSLVRLAFPVAGVPAYPFLHALLAVSPDGSRIVYAAERAGRMQLFSRAINQFEAVPLEGTENAFGPFFSPDGQWIGFFADGKLKKTTVTGGKPVSICEAVDGLSGSWGLDDVIVFQSRYGSGLQSVRPAGDSPPKSLTVLDSGKGEVAHLWPQILPGGKAILLTICTGDIGSYDDARIAVQVIGEAKPRSLDLHGASARYVPTGHLIYAQNGRLLAVPFDLSHLTITGIPQAVIEGVLTMFAGAAEFALSETGTLAYIPGGAYQPDRAVVLADRRGVFRPFSKEHAYYLEPAVSKSGSVIVRIQAANDDLWLFDSHRGRPVRLTTLDGDEVNPVWTPDGKRIVFSWGRTGARNLYWMNTDGSGKPELLNESNNNQIPGSVSPDGNVLAFWEENPRNRRDIYLLPLKGERKPQPFMVTSFDEWAPKFSPDGRFIAFASDKSGRDEVYVKAVQGPTGERQISSEGGMWPAWSHKGRELFFVSDNKLMCAGIDPESGTPGSTEFLFEVPKLIQNRIVPVYDVMPDDKSFVMVVRDIPPPPRELRVVLNWFEELKRLAPTGKK